MIRLIIVAAIFFASTLAYAEPVYLQCTLSDSEPNKEAKTFSVKLDEASGKITHTRGNGSAFNTEGFFEANKITYQSISPLSKGITLTEKYEIDRTTLDVKRSLIVRSSDPRVQERVSEEAKKPIETKGSCRVVKVKEDRKI